MPHNNKLGNLDIFECVPNCIMKIKGEDDYVF